MKPAACVLLAASWLLAAQLSSATTSCPSNQYQVAFLVSDCTEKSGQGADLFLNSSEVQLLARLPEGQFGARLQLFAPLDLKLYLFDDVLDRYIVGPGCDFETACASEAENCIRYERMGIYYSGDDIASPNLETIRVTGIVRKKMSFRAGTNASGVSQYMYSFGEMTPCPAAWPGCELCSNFTECLSWQAPQCDGSRTVVCTPSSTTFTSTTTTTTSSTTTATTTTTTTTSITTTNTSTSTTSSTTMTTTTFTCALGDYLIPGSRLCTGHLSSSCFDLPPSCLPCSLYPDCRALEMPSCNGTDIVNCSAPLVVLEVATAMVDGAESSSPCSATLEVDGVWAPSQMLFTSVARGEVVRASFLASSWPTRVRLTLHGDDVWGLRWIRLTLGQRTQYVLQSSALSGHPAGDNPYWVGGAGSAQRDYGVPKDIFLQLHVHTSSQAGAGTTSPLRFALETAGEWSENRTLFTGAVPGQVMSMDILASQWPTNLRLSAGGPDAYGFRAVRMVFRGEERWLLQSADGMSMGSVRRLAALSWQRFWLSTIPPAPPEHVLTVPAGTQTSPGGALGAFQGPSCEPSQLRSAVVVLDCLGGAGAFAVELRGGQNVTIAELPVGASDARLQLSSFATSGGTGSGASPAEFDIELVDGFTSTCLVGGHGCLHSTACTNASDYCIRHGGLQIHYSGGGSANQSLEVIGRFDRPLSLRAAPRTDGIANATFSHGQLSVCPHPLPGCLPCSSVLTCGLQGPPRCDGGPLLACEGTTTTTSSTATLTTSATSTTTSTSSTATLSSTTTTLSSTTTTITSTTATTTTAALVVQVSWVVSDWGACHPTECGQGLRSRLVSCPGASLSCSASGPTPAWQEACEDRSWCFESPFCSSGSTSCQFEHWLIIILIVLACLCCLGLCASWHMRISLLPKRQSARRSARTSRQSRQSRQSLRNRVSEAGVSPMGLQERSTSCHLGEGDLKDTGVSSVEIIHCIGEPPGYFEVLNSKVGGKSQDSSPDVKKLTFDIDAESPTQLPSPPADLSSVLPMDFMPASLEAVSSAAPAPYKDGPDSSRPQNRGTSWDIPAEAVNPVTALEMPCSRTSGPDSYCDRDPKWANAMRIVDTTTREISEVMAEVRSAPRRRKPQLFQRLRSLETDPEYLKAKQYLEEDPQLQKPGADGKSSGGLLCCMGNSSADRQVLGRTESAQAHCSGGGVFWTGGDDEDLSDNRSEPYPFAL